MKSSVGEKCVGVGYEQANVEISGHQTVVQPSKPNDERRESMVAARENVAGCDAC